MRMLLLSFQIITMLFARCYQDHQLSEAGMNGTYSMCEREEKCKIWL
jgi:hypothetical protein